MMRARRSARQRPGVVGAGLAVVVALALTGCQTDGRTTPTPEATTSATPEPTPSLASSDPAGVLAHYGLELPPSATAVVAERRADDVMSDSFIVTFSADADEVAQMCADAGIGEPLVAAVLSETQRAELEVDGPPEGAQICSASNPDDMAQQIRVLFHGEPLATVRMALFTMPSR